MRPDVGRYAIGAVLLLSCAAGAGYKWYRESSTGPRSFSALGESVPERGPSLDEIARAGPLEVRPLSSAAVAAVGKVRDRRVGLPLVAEPSQRLVFTRGRLAILGEHEVVVRRVPSFEIVAKASLSLGYALTELADSSLLVVSGGETLRLEEGKTRFQSLPRVSFFPGAALMGDRSRAQQFWIFEARSASLYRYEPWGEDAGARALPNSAALPDFDNRGFALLKDGAFVYTTASGLRRFFTSAKRTQLSFDGLGAGVTRIFSARRLDQAWLVASDGGLRLVSLTNPVRVLQTLALPSGIYDIQIDDERIVLLRSEPSSERRWELCVYDVSGERRWCEALPGQAASGSNDDWVARIVQNKNLAVSRYAPFAAVGGPDELRVWNVESGERVSVPGQ